MRAPRVLRRSSEATVERLEAARMADDPAAYLAMARSAAATFPRDGEVLAELALALSQSKQWDEAADVATSVIKVTADPRLIVQAAWSLVTVGRTEHIGAPLDAVLASGPDIPLILSEALFLRAAAYWGAGRLHLAERFFRDALSRDLERPTYIHGLAAFLLAQDRRDEALELLNLAERVADDADRAEILEDLTAMGLIRPPSPGAARPGHLGSGPQVP